MDLNKCLVLIGRYLPIIIFLQFAIFFNICTTHTAKVAKLNYTCSIIPNKNDYWKITKFVHSSTCNCNLKTLNLTHSQYSAFLHQVFPILDRPIWMTLVLANYAHAIRLAKLNLSSPSHPSHSYIFSSK